jgi:hypothetical protein
MQSSKTQEYILKYLTILEKNFKLYKKRIPLSEIVEMLTDLNDMFNEYYLENTSLCSDIARTRYLPLLKLVMQLDKSQENRGKYQSFMRNAYRMSSFNSLHHYMLYREWDEKDKFYLPRLKILQGYIYYLQQIDNPNSKVNLVIANLPSGYGKTFPEKVSEAWSFGRDPTGTILSLCSNINVVRGGSNVVRSEMKSEKFGDVFPNMRFSKDDKDYFLKETDGEWKLRDCRLIASYYADTINSNVVGERASRRIHIDDLYANYIEAMNQNTNEEYYNNFTTVWKKRFIQDAVEKVVVTGTLWASGDFIARLIESEEKDHTFSDDKMYPYTKISEDGTVVIIQVPALDYKTGLSTCPELRTTETILKEKARIPEYLFQTNFQQRPVDPEAMEFSYNRLRTYTSKIPRGDASCYAVIDANRKTGKDFFAMPILQKVYVGEDEYDYALVDCLFTRTATKDMYQEIVDKIIEYRIIVLVIESNVTSELKKNIDAILKINGIFYCDIREKWNEARKSERITNEKSVITRKIVFPERSLFPIQSQMGDFMNNLTTYNSKGRNENDDAPDSLAMFCSEIIEDGSKTPRIAVFKRPF